jgi:hypothetical protein
MRGFLYRTGIRIKEAGERWGRPSIVSLGLGLVDWVRQWA